jgi:hypothetical protein
MSDLNLFDRIVDLVARHQLLSLIGALVLGLSAPAGLRRFARGTVVVAFWVAVLIYLLPVGALWLALQVVGIHVLPEDDLPRGSSQQMWLPFDP